MRQFESQMLPRQMFDRQNRREYAIMHQSLFKFSIIDRRIEPFLKNNFILYNSNSNSNSYFNEFFSEIKNKIIK